MALSKEKKAEVVSDVSGLLAGSKLTVIARYQGTSVKSMQALRKQAAESGTHVHVVKNRLFKKALESDPRFSAVDSSQINGQLMYAFNSEDELAPAQSLANFAKKEPQIEFVGAISPDGKLMPAEDVRALADLPTKDQLRAMLVGTIGAPISGFANVLAGNVRGLLNVLNAKAEANQ